MSSRTNGLKLKSKAEKLQFSEGLNRNQKPQAIIGDILLHTKTNYKSRKGKQFRLKSLGNDHISLKNHTIDMSDGDSSFINNSGHFKPALKSSLARINDQRNYMNRTTMNFIHTSD
jgi:hypothetical protein